MKKIILPILILLSVLLCALAIQNFSAPKLKATTPDITYSKVVKKNRLEKLNTLLPAPLYRHNAPIIAVFFMYAKNCNACFNEVNGYIHLLGEKNKKRPISIPLYGIFHHPDAGVAKRFKQTTDLNFDNVVAMNGESLFDKDYLTFNGVKAYNQLVFFNNKGDLFFRILLPTGITTPKEKKEEVLNLILNPHTKS